MSAMSTQSVPVVFRPDRGSASETKESPHTPMLYLDRSGTIQRANESARRALEYGINDTLEPCFFSHVHGRNLHRVMRDLAHMVSHRTQRTRWLLRLRTGNGRWRWYRAMARNHLDRANARIRVQLRPL
ncbi:PAS domain-containing protein [Salinibacter ruber]|nr:PAS domain-containing protein [Salinibacter ruber]